MVLIFFAGCNLLFKEEISSRPLTVFNKSSTVQLDTFPRETCRTSTTYYITDEINSRWVEFHNTRTFFIRREDRNRNRRGYNHFLEVGINTQVDYLYWKTTETHLVEEENGTWLYTCKKLFPPPRVVLFGQLTKYCRKTKLDNVSMRCVLFIMIT